MGMIVSMIMIVVMMMIVVMVMVVVVMMILCAATEKIVKLFLFGLFMV